MRFITLLDLHAGTDAVLDKSRALPDSAAVGLYVPRVTALRDELAVFTGKDPTKLPLAYRVELAEADARHDGFGRAFFALTEFYLQLPTAKPAQRLAAAAMRPVFLPTLDELNASYETESGTARQRRPLAKRHEATLKSLRIDAKHTAYGLVVLMHDAGDALGELLQKRADAGAKKVPVDTRALLRVRGALLGVLSRFRAALEDERGQNGVTPARIAALFARLDEAGTKRAGAAAKKQATAKKKAATKTVPAAKPA